MRKFLFFILTFILGVGSSSAEDYTKGWYTLKNSTYCTFYGNTAYNHQYGGSSTATSSVTFVFEDAGDGAYYWKDVINQRYLYVNTNNYVVSSTEKDPSNSKYKWCIITNSNGTVNITTADQYNSGSPTTGIVGENNSTGGWLVNAAYSTNSRSKDLRLTKIADTDQLFYLALGRGGSRYLYHDSNKMKQAVYSSKGDDANYLWYATKNEDGRLQLHSLGNQVPMGYAANATAGADKIATTNKKKAYTPCVSGNSSYPISLKTELSSGQYLSNNGGTNKANMGLYASIDAGGQLSVEAYTTEVSFYKVIIKSTEDATVTTTSTSCINSGLNVKDGEYLLFTSSPSQSELSCTLSGASIVVDTDQKTITVNPETTETNLYIEASETCKLSEITQDDYDAIVLRGGCLVVDAELTKNVYVKTQSSVMVTEGNTFDGSKVLLNLDRITLHGSGVATNVTTDATLIPCLAFSWTGTVRLTGTLTAMALNDLGTANSFVEFKGASGYLTKANQTALTYTPNLILTNDGSTIAYNNNNGWDNDNRTFSGSVSGGGTFKRTNAGTTQTFVFSGNVAGWTGKFNHEINATTNVKFTGSATTINASLEKSGTNGSFNIVVSNNRDVIINGTIKQAAMLTLEGTGKKTFAAAVTAVTLVAPETSNIGILGTTTLSVTDIQTVTTLNIEMSNDDLQTALSSFESYDLITYSGSSSVTSLTLNGVSYYTLGDYIYSIVDTGAGISIQKTPAKIDRTTATGKFGTICLPYAATVSGATVYTASVNATNDAVILYELTGTTLEAGVPYIYKSTDGSPEFTRSGEEALLSTPSNPTSGLKGTFTSTLAPEDSYVLQTIDETQKFRKVVSGQQPTVTPYRCYIEPATVTAREMSIQIGTITAVDALNAIVDNKAEIYDVSGRKLNTLRKGLNILNGVKVIVK